MNKYWAIWGDGDFVGAILFFITAIAIAFYFEIKYLDERKKNKELHDLFIQYNKPPTAPLNPIIINQKSKAGKFTLGDVPTKGNDTK